MIKKNIIVSALILSLCAAALTSCGGNMNDNDPSGERVTTDTADKDTKETNDSIADKVESGMEDIGSDIKDSISNPEEATHGTEANGSDNVEGDTSDTGNGTMGDDVNGTDSTTGNRNTQTDAPRHRKAVPFGK